jgi:hypothetical protein
MADRKKSPGSERRTIAKIVKVEKLTLGVCSQEGRFFRARHVVVQHGNGSWQAGRKAALA